MILLTDDMDFDTVSHGRISHPQMVLAITKLNC